MSATVHFPEGFLWGAATASHQIEGANYNSDWYEWEKKGKIKDNSSSDPGCQSEKYYERDITFLSDLNLNAYRFSVEWAKIQPDENSFCENHLQRYCKIVDILLSKRIEPVVTLHHFVNPLWFYNKGAFEKPENISFFLKFVEKMVSAFKEKVQYYTVINEPIVYAFTSYIDGSWPPGKKDWNAGMAVVRNLLVAYDEAYKIIKKINPNAKISVAKHTAVYRPYLSFSPIDIIASRTIQRYFDHAFIDSILDGKFAKPFGKNEKYSFSSDFDFIGINYYTKRFIHINKKNIETKTKDGMKTDIGWHYYPQGLYEVVDRFSKRYHKPLMITENGIADSEDRYRTAYIVSALYSINQAMKEGANVMGYMYWSLMDNFEWVEGNSMRFGLLQTDYNNNVLYMRNSAKIYSKIASDNKIEESTLKFIK